MVGIKQVFVYVSVFPAILGALFSSYLLSLSSDPVAEKENLVLFAIISSIAAMLGYVVVLFYQSKVDSLAKLSLGVLLIALAPASPLIVSLFASFIPIVGPFIGIGVGLFATPFGAWVLAETLLIRSSSADTRGRSELPPST